MLLYGSRSVMACTCLLVTKYNAVDDHSIGFFFSSCLLVEGKQLCSDILSVFGSQDICENILCLIENKNCVWCWWQLCGTDNIASWEQFRKMQKWLTMEKQMHSLSAQYLFNADVADKSLCLSSVSVQSRHTVSGISHYSRKKEWMSSGMREGRVEDVVERMTKKGKMRLRKQERLRVQRQTVREEVS